MHLVLPFSLMRNNCTAVWKVCAWLGLGAFIVAVVPVRSGLGADPLLVPPALKGTGQPWKIIIRPAVPDNGPVFYEDSAPQVARDEPTPPAAASRPARPAPQDGPQPAANAAGPDAFANRGTPFLVTYQQAYQSIPFSRSEYEANPNFRHDAALEMMFGTMRPTTIVRQTIPYFSRYPDIFRYRFPVFPYSNQGADTLNSGVFFSPY